MDNKRKKVSFSGKPEVKIIESTRHEATSSLSMELTLDLTQTQNTVLINNSVPKAIEHKPATSFFNALFDDESDNNVNIGTLSEELNVDQKDVFENLLANASTVEDCDFNSPLVNDNDYKSKELSIINNLVPVKISEYEIDEQNDKSLHFTDTIAETQLNKKEEITKFDANNTNIITTQDIEKLVKQNSVTLNEVLVVNNIILHDKIFLNEQRRTSCIPLSNIKDEEYFYDMYVMKNQAEYYKKFNSFLRSDSANREERIKELEPRIYMQEKEIDFQKLKRYARDKASNEWYLMRYEKEKENVEELKKIEEVIDSFLSDENNLEQEISTIEKENKQLALEIDETKRKMIFSTEENVQDKIDIIKNYFMSQMNIKDTNNVSAEGEFVLKQLTYDELKKEGTAELVNLMESEIMTIKKRNEHFYNKKKEHESKIKDIENKIRDCEEKYKILNATKEDCEEAVKKYQLMLEMLCINLKTVSTKEIAFDIFDFYVTYRKEFIIEIRKNKCDLYDFFLGKIQQNNLRSVLYALLDLYLLNKEIKGHQIYLNEDSVEIYVNDKTVSFNLENVLVTKNEMILFSGMRKYGMIKSFLDKV